MSEAHADTFSPRDITVMVGLLLAAIIIGEVLIGPHRDEQVVPEPMDTKEDIAMRLKPVISLDQMRSNMTVASAAGDSADKSPEQLYQAACLACHNTGAAGAPKIGDAAGWKSRIAKGLDALASAAVKGIGAMPPRGGSQYSDDQIRSVVEYILAKSR